jgi:hemerythrin
MEIIKWTEEYSVGIKEIDNQHKGLVILINELFTLITKGKSKDSLSEIFDYLTDYTKKHFFTEETLLYKYAYPEIDQHKLEHSKFIENLSNLKSDFDRNKITISIETLNFLKDWLLNHIKISDKRYSVHISKVDNER